MWQESSTEAVSAACSHAVFHGQERSARVAYFGCGIARTRRGGKSTGRQGRCTMVMRLRQPYPGERPPSKFAPRQRQRSPCRAFARFRTPRGTGGRLQTTPRPCLRVATNIHIAATRVTLLRAGGTMHNHTRKRPHACARSVAAARTRHAARTHNPMCMGAPCRHRGKRARGLVGRGAHVQSHAVAAECCDFKGVMNARVWRPNPSALVNTVTVT